MKRKKILAAGAVLIVLAVIITLSVTAYNASKPKYHVGTWHIELFDEDNVLVINPNKTIEYKWYTGNSGHGKYKVVKTTDDYVEITVKPDGTYVTAQFRAYDDLMINYTSIITFKRINATLGKRFDEGLYGTWAAPGYSEMLNIREDCTAYLGVKYNYTYVRRGGAYLMTDTETGQRMIFDYDGERVTLMFGGNIYEREQTEEQMQKSE